MDAKEERWTNSLKVQQKTATGVKGFLEMLNQNVKFLGNAITF